MKLTLIAISLLTILMIGCTHKSGHEDALAAHNTAEKVKDTWAKQTKPLEINIVDRTKEELEAIGSIGVWINNSVEAATEFHYDGKSFKPRTPLMIDSTAVVKVVYPYRANMHLGDTITLQQPVGPQMVGKFISIENNEENYMAKIELKDQMALLRIRLKSDNIEDILNEIFLSNIIAVDGQIVIDNGVSRFNVSTNKATFLTDCPLNNGMPHDFFIFPNEESVEPIFIITVNKKDYKISTQLPPMRMGSITELYLTLNKGKLSVGSSWVDSKHPFSKPAVTQPETINVGNFLQKDGSISTTYNDGSIAMVIEVNGKHGRAVALKDNNAAKVFNKKAFFTGHTYETADGKYKEGCFYSKVKAENEPLIQFAPKVFYNAKSAFAERNGASSSVRIIDNCSEEERKAFNEAAGFGTAYIPSLFELASLAQELMVHKDDTPKEFEKPEGFYMTSCESGADTFYGIDLQNFKISAFNSKAYPNTNLRLFYLF